MKSSNLRFTIPSVGLAMCLAGASVAIALADESDGGDSGGAVAVSALTTTAAIAANATDHDETADYSWDEADIIPIELTGTTATSDSAGVSTSDGTVTITSAGTYELTGTLTDGQIIVKTSDTGVVRLILNEVDITSTTSSCIQISKAEKAMVVLADGTTNNLTDATEYVYPDADTDEPNAALFSKANLTIAGEGTLNVDGNAYDGIASKDGLILHSGTIVVDAVDDGIRGKDYLVIDGGTVSVTAGGDGLKSTNDDSDLGYLLVNDGSVTVTSDGDGLSAATDVILTGGVLDLTAGGGHTAALAEDVSAKGVKGEVSVVIGSGQLTVDTAEDAIHSDAAISITGGSQDLAAADDGVHAETSLAIADGDLTVSTATEGLESAIITVTGGTIALTTTDDGINGSDGVTDSALTSSAVLVTLAGGEIVVTADGDGIDSNGALEITGGTIVANGPSRSDNASVDVNGTFTISGGTLMAVGATGMLSTPASTSAQGWLAYDFAETQPSGTIVHIATTDGTDLAVFEAAREFQSLLFSSEQIVTGQEYDLYTGGDATGTSTNGLYSEGTLDTATKVSSVTAGEYTGGMNPGGGDGWDCVTDPADMPSDMPSDMTMPSDMGAPSDMTMPSDMPSDMGSEMGSEMAPPGTDASNAASPAPTSSDCETVPASETSASADSDSGSESSSGSLPVTGTRILQITALGLAMLVVGAALLVATRRRGTRTAPAGDGSPTNVGPPTS